MSKGVARCPAVGVSCYPLCQGFPTAHPLLRGWPCLHVCDWGLVCRQGCVSREGPWGEAPEAALGRPKGECEL